MLRIGDGRSRNLFYFIKIAKNLLRTSEICRKTRQYEITLNTSDSVATQGLSTTTNNYGTLINTATLLLLSDRSRVRFAPRVPNHRQLRYKRTLLLVYCAIFHTELIFVLLYMQLDAQLLRGSNFDIINKTRIV